MKAGFIYTILFSIICMLFSACNNSIISITKRQYRNGYHVNFKGRGDVANNKELKGEQAPHSTDETAAIETGEVESPINETSENKNPDKREIIDSSVSLLKSGRLEKTINKISHPVKIAISKPILKRNAASVNSENSQEGIIKNLVWFCIVILLLAYIIAIAAGGFGLGIAVHLILVAAIVLLVIKLLTPV